MPQIKRFKRTHYIVDKNIQYRYVGLLFFYTVIFFILSIAIIYFAGWRQLIEKLSNVYPQARLVEIFNGIYLRLSLGFLLLSVIAVISAVLVSHKIAGPLVRIRRALGQLISGDYDFFVKLRKGDQLQDVASQINTLAEKLKKKNV
jgi:nitrogen fixation/metabolism regulation signal transduction histidine kinase